MCEKWRAVAGYEGLYEVSDMGRVRSLPRTIRRPHTRDYHAPGRVLKQRPANDHGHLAVTLSREGFTEKMWVHRLVALAWCPRPDGADYVLHGPGGPTDNRASELRWGTAQENSDDKYVHGTVPVYVPATHCKWGHEFTEENTYRPPRRPGDRHCKECQRARVRKYAKGVRGGRVQG